MNPATYESTEIMLFFTVFCKNRGFKFKNFHIIDSGGSLMVTSEKSGINYKLTLQECEKEDLTDIMKEHHFNMIGKKVRYELN